MNISSISWATDHFKSQGDSSSHFVPEIIQSTPWSEVTRFETTKGFVYLKKTPPALSLEPDVIKILSEKCPDEVPVIIAVNKELNCFLMSDSGIALRKFFQAGFKPELLCEAIKNYTAMQLSTADNINAFVEIGVPDWRLEKIPELYKHYIAHEELLISDGLTQNELEKLRQLQSEITRLCETLSNYKIPATLDHSDFRDNNILIDAETQKITIIDFGETVISHPFFSLMNCLRDVQWRYSLKETDKAYLQLQKACFENLLPFESHENLLEIFSYTKKLWPICENLAQYRLVMSCDATSFQALNRHGRLTRGLKEFIQSSL